MTFLNLLPTITNLKGISVHGKSNGENNSYNNGFLFQNTRDINVVNSEKLTSGLRSNNIGKSNTMTSLSIIGAILILSTWPNLINGQRSGLFTSPLRREMSPYKGFSGFRVRPDSLALVYVHDQTVAVVEVGSNRELYNCELIEIYKQNQGEELLKNLTALIGKPVTISFDQMMDLMENCQLLDTPEILKTRKENEIGGPARGFASSQSTILSGIIPGTKWCGAGDLAETFYDLGKEEKLDRCCRTHDICPSKVRPSTTRYSLTNNAIFTKSHCTCDYKFLQCLKKTKSPTADIMGNFYFNLLRVPCLNITGHRFQTAYRY